MCQANRGGKEGGRVQLGRGDMRWVARTPHHTSYWRRRSRRYGFGSVGRKKNDCDARVKVEECQVTLAALKNDG
jgi:hypothetical protein